MSNANKAKPGVTIRLGDKTLTLVFDLWALVTVERTVGKTVSELLQGGSMEGVLVMLWAALHNHHPDITEEEVGHLVDLQNINYISETLGEAMSQAAPEGKGSSSKNVKSQSSGTGSKSGQSEGTTSA